MTYEYKVVPAPRRGKRGGSVKGPAGRFAFSIEATLNGMAAEGWEFVRAETLGADEYHGIMRRKNETFHGVLVFKRELDAEDEPSTVASRPTKPEMSKKRQIPTPNDHAEPQVFSEAPSHTPVKERQFDDASEMDETPQLDSQPDDSSRAKA